MSFGRSIRIYLPDGSASGLRHVEIANWSGQAIACPRSRFSELASWEEAQRPGVYFLLEQHSTDDRSTVYIGESENVFKRLNDHDRKKEFWNEVIIFTSKDENLTKAHIKYLEARLVTLTIIADRYSLENGNTPPQSSLPRADKDAMEEFIYNSKMILGTLGHKLLEPLTLPMQEEVNKDNETIMRIELYFNVNNIKAIGQQSDEGFILIENSKISKETTQSIPGKVTQLRNKLIEDGILKDNGKDYVLTKSTLISSPSYAAALVAGTSRSGPQSWKDKNGKTLKEIEENLLKT